MFDARARAVLESPLARCAGFLDRPGISPDRVTVVGIGLGLAGAAGAAAGWWPLALVLWLASRAADGLDGALARRRRAVCAAPDPGAGAFLDITGDFLVYGAFVVGVGVGTDGSLLPFLAVLLAYYINGAAFLAFSSIAERTGQQIADGRSLSFPGGLAEGSETILVHALWCLVPFWAPEVAWVWALVVGVSAAQRVIGGYRSLSRPGARS